MIRTITKTPSHLRRLSATTIFVFLVAAVGGALLHGGLAFAASSWKSQVRPEYYVYTNGNTVIANKASLTAYPAVWVRETFMPRITTQGVGCDKGSDGTANDVVTHAFNSSLEFNNCDGLKIQEKTSPAANNQWFQDVNMSYIIGDFDNHETIDIGRGFIVASGRSAIGTPRGQTATAEKDARDTTGSNKYDCDNPNPNRSKDCSLLIYFTNGDAGDFHITVDDNGYKNSIHEYWYDGPVTVPYHTLIFNPSGGSVEENHADSNMLISRKSGANLLRDYDGGIKEGTKSTANVVATGFPVPQRSGYIFRGWYTSANGDCVASKNCLLSQPMGKEADSKGNITLYAHWIPVPGSYELVPHIDTPVDTVRQGDSVTFTPSVTKNGSVDTNGTTWKLCRLVLAPGAAVPANGSVCSDAAAKVVETKANYVFSGAGPFSVGDPANYTYIIPGGTQYGSQICYALFVDSSTQDPGHPAEAVKCVIVAKYPAVHIVGGDVKVGDSVFPDLTNEDASIQTGRFNVDGRAYGSWAEYGLFAPSNGAIISSSGGMLSGANGADATQVNEVAQNRLTFANVSTYGYWAPAQLVYLPNAITRTASVSSSLTSTQVDLGGNVSAANGEVKLWNVTSAGGTVNLRGTLPAGSGSVIVVYDGTVNINGDVRLGDSAVSRIGAASQVIIVARNITIEPGVSNVDAWLFATPSTSVSTDGRISTCGAIQSDAYYTGLTIGGDCDKTPLRITGPVIARELQLRRTFADDANNATAAETINLRPDAYMWGNTNGGSVDIETSFIKELPPRL